MSKRIIMLIVIITISLGSISVCNEQISATTDTNKQTFYAVADAYIAENHPTYILTNQTYVRIRGLTAWHFNGLLQFDLSPIAPENTVSSAKLKLYYYSSEDGSTAGHTLNLYRITSNWNKENVTWNTRPSYNGTIIASAVVPSTVGTWIEWDVTNDVQSFINDQTVNYGWEIIDPASSDNSQTYFYSNEYGSDRPYLEIEFATATDTTKQTIYPTADAYIAENHPTYILNNETFVRIRGLAGWHFNGLFQFNITSIDTENTISS
ncbi:MAG: DNRLRE domain-containing protein, partial [Euryarchaeota archaeon]|nr:DNRLRE domain-containing protein [Euryarchaeota archaeon]